MNIVASVLIGISFGMGLSNIVSLMDSHSYRNIQKSAIAKCEKDLPRSETCVIIAVPKQK